LIKLIALEQKAFQITKEAGSQTCSDNEISRAHASRIDGIYTSYLKFHNLDSAI
jgi:hypothetical protein